MAANKTFSSPLLPIYKNNPNVIKYEHAYKTQETDSAYLEPA